MPWTPIWVGASYGPRCSQYPFDPYSFIHVDHGIIMYFMFGGGDWWRYLLCLALEITWEVVENSNWIINKYRAGGGSPNYKGDSTQNSIGDCISCSFGYFLSLLMPWQVCLTYVVTSEIMLTLLIRDSLTLTLIQLALNVKWIKDWQSARLEPDGPAGGGPKEK